MRETRSKAPRSARLVVVGAGFAGGSLVRNLPPRLRRPGETLLVDRESRYPFIPLIHEVAAGRIHPESILFPISRLCEGRCGFLQAEVTGVDLDRKTLATSAGEVRYEYLALCPGSVSSPPPEPLRPYFQTFGTLDDALKLRETLSNAWRDAARGHRPPGRGALTVAIVGGGTTGVELAGEIAALFGYLRRRTARRLPEEPRVVLFEAEKRMMGWLTPYFHDVAARELARLGVEVRTNDPVVTADEVGVGSKNMRLPARVRVWTGGVEPPPLLDGLPGERGYAGRLKTNRHLILPEHPEVYVLGDAAEPDDPRHGPLPPTASVAVQQGPWAAGDLDRRLSGTRLRPSFRFFDRGYVVSLGPGNAVAEALGVRLRGRAAQALYRSIFLYYMNNRRDRLLTGADWTMGRVGRLGFDPGDRKTVAH